MEQQILSIMEGQRIKSHILKDLSSRGSEESETSEIYLLWKKDDSLIRSGLKELLPKKFYIWWAALPLPMKCGNHSKKLLHRTLKIEKGP